MEIKSKLLTVIVALFFATQLLNFLSVEGPYDAILSLTFLEFTQPFFILTLSLISLQLFLVAPRNFSKFLFVFTQTVMILTEIFVMIMIKINMTSSIVGVFDQVGMAIFGLIVLCRIYLIFTVNNLPVNAQA
jgi:hypothetical protein